MYHYKNIHTPDLNELTKIIQNVKNELDNTTYIDEHKNEILLIINEIITNIIRHTNIQNLTFSFNFNIENDICELFFTDNGKKFNPIEFRTTPDYVKNNGKVNKVTPGGLGILLYKNFSDNIYYNYTNGYNYLKIKKKLLTNSSLEISELSNTKSKYKYFKIKGVISQTTKNIIKKKIIDNPVNKIYFDISRVSYFLSQSISILIDLIKDNSIRIICSNKEICKILDLANIDYSEHIDNAHF